MVLYLILHIGGGALGHPKVFINLVSDKLFFSFKRIISTMHSLNKKLNEKFVFVTGKKNI